MRELKQDMSGENDKRVNRIRRALGCKVDAELASKLSTYQPNISRWRSKGFHPSTALLIDSLLSVIKFLKKEIAELKKEIAELKKAIPKDKSGVAD